MISATTIATGDTVETLGYGTVGDGGGNIFEVEDSASGSADGGSLIKLPNSGNRWAIAFRNGATEVKAEQFGVVLDSSGAAQERSEQFNTAFAFAASATDETLGSNDLLDPNTQGIDFSCATDFTAKDTLNLTRSGGTAENMSIRLTCQVKVVTGGDLEDHTDSEPIPLFLLKLRNCEVVWPKMHLEQICAGIKAKLDVGNSHYGCDIRHFRRYGLWKVAGNDSTWYDPIIKQWPVRQNEIELNGRWSNVWSNWDGDCIVVSTKDHRFYGGQVGWAGTCVRLLDGLPENNPTINEVALGEDAYWCGLESSKFDGDNGAGDVYFDHLHMMQNPGEDQSPRDDNIANGGPIGLLSYSRKSNPVFFLNLDNDGCVHNIYGAQVHFDHDTVGSQSKPNTNPSSSSYTIDPIVRYFADGEDRYPFMVEAHRMNGVTIGFFDHGETSWQGDYSEWNYMNRADTGSYKGPIQFQGTLDIGIVSALPSSSAEKGDYWLLVGGDVGNNGNLGGQLVTSGEILYCLANTPSSSWSSDWSHVAGDSAPIRKSHRFRNEIRYPEHILYPHEDYSTTGKTIQRTLHSSSGKIGERLVVRGGANDGEYQRVFDGAAVKHTGADHYEFDEEIRTPNGISFDGGINTLGAFEAGSFTPVIADAETAGNTGSAQFKSGVYQRIGKMVMGNLNLGNIDPSGLTSGNDIFIQGLPFSAGSDARIGGSVRLKSAVFNDPPTVFGESGSSALRIALNVSNSSAKHFLKVSDLDTSGNTSDIHLQFFYLTDDT